MKIKSFTFNALQENTYLLIDDSGECAIIDPGCMDRSEKDTIDSYISSNNLKVVHLLNTHCHIDHVLGNRHIMEKYNVNLYIHPFEEEILKSASVYAPFYGFHHYEGAEKWNFLAEGETIIFGNTKLEVMFLPGHSPGHVAFIEHHGASVISGDVLFYRSIGRTDLPGGNHKDLIDSISRKLFMLPENYTVFPGHGPKTTIGDEGAENPFFN